MNIGFIVGSLRQGAYTRLLSQAVQEIAQPALKLTEIGIGELPFYNQDLETDTPPAQWVAFRHQVRRNDAILFITPEYNRGMPGAVKNAIDVGSRPMKDSVWNGRPTAVISLTPRQARSDGRQSAASADVVRDRLAGAAASGGLYRQRGRPVRRQRQTQQRRDTQVSGQGARRLRNLDRALQVGLFVPVGGRLLFLDAFGSHRAADRLP